MKIITGFSFECNSNFDTPMINAAVFETPYGEMRIDRDTTNYSFEDGVLSMDWEQPYLLNIYDVGMEEESHYIRVDLFKDATLKALELEDDAYLECENYYCDCIDWTYLAEEPWWEDKHRPYVAPDWDDYELVSGQDHEWYLYSNKNDSWYPTGFSWNRVDEDEMIAAINAMGVGGDWIPDCDYFNDI